jgi:endogenous inhibitor of DNA gyrase (YacG/DUF329 family)
LSIAFAARTTARCPTCGEDVPRNAIGRPRTFCSPACRRTMRDQRQELVELEAQLAETSELAANAHNDHWRQRHLRMAAALTLAIAEARSRIPGALP